MSNPFLGKPEGSGDKAWYYDDGLDEWRLVETGSFGGSSGSSGPDGDFEVSGSTLFTTSSVVIGQASDVDELGSDIIFYVSGSISGSEKAVFGGDVRVSGSLVVGTGSIHIVDNEIRSTDQLKFFDSDNPSGTTLSELKSSTVTTVKTADYTASLGEEVRYNASGSFALTTPPNPSDGDRVSFHNVGALTSSITITANSGSTVGDPFDAVPGTPGTSYAVTLAYFQIDYRYYIDSTAWLIV